MAGERQEAPTTFGYRSPAHGRGKWGPWLMVGLAAFAVFRLVVGPPTTGQAVFQATVLVIAVTEFVWLTRLRRVLVTELRVTGHELVGTTARLTYRVDLSATPATALTRPHRWGYRLVFSDNTSLRVSIQSRDWAEFVTALEAAQKSPIDQSMIGEIRTSGYWFSDEQAGFFEDTLT